MHHPPFLTGLAEMDAINCDNSAALGAIVAEHPQIERIVCGHVHRPMVIRWNGTVVTTAPATAHQVALNLLDGTPTAWIMEPPACHLHYWRADSGLVTHHQLHRGLRRADAVLRPDLAHPSALMSSPGLTRRPGVPLTEADARSSPGLTVSRRSDIRDRAPRHGSGSRSRGARGMMMSPFSSMMGAS